MFQKRTTVVLVLMLAITLVGEASNFNPIVVRPQLDKVSSWMTRPCLQSPQSNLDIVSALDQKKYTSVPRTIYPVLPPIIIPEKPLDLMVPIPQGPTTPEVEPLVPAVPPGDTPKARPKLIPPGEIK